LFRYPDRRWFVVMISISKLAASVLLRNCKDRKINAGKIFQLNKKGQRYTVQLDKPKKNDRMMHYGDSVVLIVDNNIEKEIGNACINVEEGRPSHNLLMRKNAITYKITSPLLLL
jgi:hypothetical protein